MLSTLWNYLRGYVIIEVTGFSIERFLNLVSKKEIHIWDLKETKRGAEMKVSVKNFKKLKPYTKKTRCHIKIKGRFGRPFFVNSLKKRQLFVIGITLFVIMVYLLSSFIWLIEIKGNLRIKTKDLLEFCEQNGFSVGSYKGSIDKKELKKILKNNFPDISWIAIEFTGTKATIELRETLPDVQKVDNSENCDIIAKNNSIVDSIVTISGTPLVRKGDVVSRGDILVSGELLIKEDETGTIKRYTHSSAKIIGRTKYKFMAKVPFKYAKKVYTGNEQNTYNLNILGKGINIYNPEIQYKNYDFFDSLNQLEITENYPLPVILKKTVYKEFNYVQKEHSYDEAKARGEQLLNQKILQYFDFNTDIIDKEFNYKKTDSSLVVTVSVTVLEDICEDKKIDISQNNENERGSNINGTTQNAN